MNKHETQTITNTPPPTTPRLLLFPTIGMSVVCGKIWHLAHLFINLAISKLKSAPSLSSSSDWLLISVLPD